MAERGVGSFQELAAIIEERTPLRFSDAEIAGFVGTENVGIPLNFWAALKIALALSGEQTVSIIAARMEPFCEVFQRRRHNN